MKEEHAIKDTRERERERTRQRKGWVKSSQKGRRVREVCVRERACVLCVRVCERKSRGSREVNVRRRDEGGCERQKRGSDRKIGQKMGHKVK